MKSFREIVLEEYHRSIRDLNLSGIQDKVNIIPCDIIPKHKKFIGSHEIIGDKHYIYISRAQCFYVYVFGEYDDKLTWTEERNLEEVVCSVVRHEMRHVWQHTILGEEYVKEIQTSFSGYGDELLVYYLQKNIFELDAREYQYADDFKRGLMISEDGMRLFYEKCRPYFFD